MILTDGGSHFRNAMIKELCEIANVHHKFASPYHPQTNGLTEKFNGTLVKGLRKMGI